MRELADLLQRTADDLVTGAGGEGEVLRVGLEDGVEGPVLDLEDQQSAAGVEDQEVGVAVLRADGDVVPAEVVVFEELAEAGGKAALAGGGLAGGGVGASSLAYRSTLDYNRRLNGFQRIPR